MCLSLTNNNINQPEWCSDKTLSRRQNIQYSSVLANFCLAELAWETWTVLLDSIPVLMSPILNIEHFWKLTKLSKREHLLRDMIILFIVILLPHFPPYFAGMFDDRNLIIETRPYLAACIDCDNFLPLDKIQVFFTLYWILFNKLVSDIFNKKCEVSRQFLTINTSSFLLLLLCGLFT